MLRAVVLVGLVGACSRTPPEPAPAPLVVPEMPTVKPLAAGSAAESSAGPSLAGRCITKLPEVGPRIPPNASGAACPPDPEGGGTMPVDDVSFLDREGAAPLKVRAELAKTPKDVERGLMYRRSMGDDEGMFFKLDKRSDHTFWMHNTCIALDMMFVDTDGLIVGIVEGAAPLNDAIRSVGCPSAYVLEVNGGWSRKHGVRPGQRITIPFSAR